LNRDSISIKLVRKTSQLTHSKSEGAIDACQP